MENPEIQSSQFVSAMEDPDFLKYYPPDYLEDQVDLIAKARRNGRKAEAEDFRAEYFYGRCKDKKTCIWPGGRDSWSDESSGITWVGVHGNDSICVVTKAGDLDLSRVHGWLIFKTKEEVFRNFRRTVISEIEDLAALAAPAAPEDPEDLEDPEDPEDHVDPLSKLREMFGNSIKKPFGVVSVVPLTDKVHKASSYEYPQSKIMKFLLEGLNKEETSSDDESEIDEDDEDERIKHLLKLNRRHERTLPDNPNYDVTKTIRFIQEEMKRDAAIKINETVEESGDEYDEEKVIEFLEEKMRRTEDFTLDGTIQIAISAFKHLFKKKFINAKEIEVCVMDPDYFVYAEEADYKDIYVKHLEMGEIEQVLADMNEPGSGGSSSADMNEPGSGGSPMSSDGSRLK